MLFRKAPKKIRGLLFKIKLGVGVLCFLALLPVVNWLYHIVRNPSQILSPFHRTLAKTPSDTWASYGESFEENATEVLTPEFLAAMAQAESAGNPVAQPYWRWDLSSNPFEIYAPASSSSGLFQLTQGTFEEAKRFCIHEGKVVRDGPWYNPSTCWFNFFYSRLSPTDSIEMTAARLQHLIDKLNYRGGRRGKQELAAIIHLCGFAKAQQAVRKGAAKIGSCGDHNVGSYLRKIRALERTFALIRSSKNGAAERRVAAQER
ncbi:MAG TPA: transglycosylase SLT domain-containing protein [Bdellovibrionales bacterium]|nr:transglycosylase SLT domain-containing protein [Bdellovibrionales bacterium]